MYILGVDEAGRGPLAGPVAVGVVRTGKDFDFLSTFPGLNDSKKLSEKHRERIFALLEAEVQKGTVSYQVLFRSAKAIDERGIAVVIRESVQEGVEVLLPEAGEGRVYLDGALRAPDIYSQETIIGGDALIPAIMLASVAAKVTRDRYMVSLGKEYPDYGFEAHKGYGTKQHQAAIQKYGPIPDVHRYSFLGL